MQVAPQVEAAKSTQVVVNVRRRWYHAVNLPLLAIVAALTAYGLVIVSSVTAGSSEYSLARQLTGVAVGIVAMIVMWKIDYRVFERLLVPLIVANIALLLAPHLPFIGVTRNGATSWIRIGSLQMQPGEPAKIVTILMMASLVARYRGRIDTLADYLRVLAILALPVVCIMLQPDMGTGMVFVAIGIAVLFSGGASIKWLLVTLAVLVAAVALALAVDPILDARAGTDVFIKDYQLNRLLVFIDSDLDPTGVGYNLQQAKIAIGSGGVWGKGLGNATQSSLGFLPEAPTDFIFCVVSESLGFMGAALLLALYGGLFYCTFKVMLGTKSRFGALIIAGIIGMWAFQIMENIGMDVGLMPITGIPLPFMSYGSSFMLVNYMAVGLIMSVWSRRTASAS